MVWTVRRHDSALLKYSGLLEQLEVLDNMMNPHPPLLQRIPKMLADQAYAPGRNVSPKSKERSLNAMADPVAAAALRDRDLLNAPYGHPTHPPPSFPAPVSFQLILILIFHHFH